MNRFTSCLCGLLFVGSAINAQAGIVLEDNFDGGIGAGTFSSNLNGSAIGDGLGGFLSGDALHFDGPGVRSVTTVGLDLTSGATLEFSFRGGNENVDGSQFWENSENSTEWVDLAYSLDGVTFTNFFELNTEMDKGENPTVWNDFAIGLSGSLLSSSTQFRWQQRGNDGTGFDHWAIDNLQISVPSVNAVPEPASMAMFGMIVSVAGFGRFRRRR